MHVRLSAGPISLYQVASQFQHHQAPCELQAYFWHIHYLSYFVIMSVGGRIGHAANVAMRSCTLSHIMACHACSRYVQVHSSQRAGPRLCQL